MSSGKSKQDEELLDQKIARIRKKNEEIIRRSQEIEKDKRLAEKQNAMVKLRPSTDDWPRERTPALRPSQREMKDCKEENDGIHTHETINRNKERTHPSSRGRDMGGRGSGPPPDPVSFLADPERDYSAEKEPPSQSSFARGSGRNAREFRRDGPRRGRGGRGRIYPGNHEVTSSANDDAWREERYRIDEARIRRQKSADGKWRREWDNEKMNFELPGDRIPPATVAPSVSHRLDKWKQHPKNYENTSTSEQPNFRARSFGRGDYSRGSRGGRGRVKAYSEYSPPERSSTDSSRIVKNLGDTFHIVVPNVTEERLDQGKEMFKHTSRRGKYQQQIRSMDKEHRTRTSHSQSSYSEDEGLKRTFENVKASKVDKREKNREPEQRNPAHNTVTSVNESEKLFDLAKSQRPPLPPFKSVNPKNMLNIKVSKDVEDGDESWEDVTSGTESVGDDCSSFTLSPKKVEASDNECATLKDPTDIYTPEDFIQLVSSDDTHPNNSACDSFSYQSSVSVKTKTLDNEDTSNLVIHKVADANLPCSADIYTPEDFIKLVQTENSKNQEENSNNITDEDVTEHCKSSSSESNIVLNTLSEYNDSIKESSQVCRASSKSNNEVNILVAEQPNKISCNFKSDSLSKDENSKLEVSENSKNQEENSNNITDEDVTEHCKSSSSESNIVLNTLSEYNDSIKESSQVCRASSKSNNEVNTLVAEQPNKISCSFKSDSLSKDENSKLEVSDTKDIETSTEYINNTSTDGSSDNNKKLCTNEANAKDEIKPKQSEISNDSNKSEDGNISGLSSINPPNSDGNTEFSNRHN
ncbi:uncharacterized protein LOC142326789 [Lycorma delicatula]|uniref:uncharacterized protein LOC142326789 n=1 Tax=Lycorma delicatula TaxID=130591 RepID=UPI003F513514